MGGGVFWECVTFSGLQLKTPAKIKGAQGIKGLITTKNVPSVCEKTEEILA